MPEFFDYLNTAFFGDFFGARTRIVQRAEAEARAAVLKAAGGNKRLETEALGKLERDFAGLRAEQAKDPQPFGLGTLWNAIAGFLGDLNTALKAPQTAIRYAVPIAAVAAALWFSPQIATGARILWKRLRSAVG